MEENENSATGELEAIRGSVVTLAVEAWRFSRSFERLLSRMDDGDVKRYRSQFDWFMKKVEDSLTQAGLSIVNVEDQPFDPGIAATPINLEEFDAEESLVVEQMLEPIIMGAHGLVKTGTVTLKKADQ